MCAASPKQLEPRPVAPEEEAEQRGHADGPDEDHEARVDLEGGVRAALAVNRVVDLEAPVVGLVAAVKGAAVERREDCGGR